MNKKPTDCSILKMRELIEHNRLDFPEEVEWLENFFFTLDGTEKDGSWKQSDYDRWIDQKFGLNFGMK